MIAIAKKSCRVEKVELQEMFLGLLPAVTKQAQFAVRYLTHEAREDAVCEIVANAFQAFHRLVELGKWDIAFARPLARFAVAQFRTGRRVGTKSNSRDIYTCRAQTRGGFRLEHLPTEASPSADWAEGLTDDTMTPIPDQVAFRIDFPAWLQRLPERDRGLALFLAMGNSAVDAARHLGVTKARVSQIRVQLRDDWIDFQGEG